jgi:competence protein ComEC
MQKFSIAFVVIAAIAAMGAAAYLIPSARQYLGRSPWKISIMLLITFAASTFCGIAYYNLRCSGSAPPSLSLSKKKIRAVDIVIRPNSIVIKDASCGKFYGYGTVLRSSKQNRDLMGARIFFSTESSVVHEIPISGQDFRVSGDLRLIGENDNWWFAKHLKNSLVRLNISGCCMIECVSKAAPFGKFLKKIADGFLKSLSVGVENRQIEVGIMTGMLTGFKRGVDEAVRSMFNDLGIAHLFAVSGIHIGVIATAINFLLKMMRVGVRWRSIPILLLLALYVNAIGCSPSALRALTMVAFYYFAALIGRKPNVLAALSNSALMHTIADPFVVFNLSFLLSYSVVAGIILIGPVLEAIFGKIFLNLHDLKLQGYGLIDRLWFRLKRTMVASLSISLAALVASLPLSIEHFGVMSPMTIPVNMFVVPVATCAIVIGAMTLFLGLFNLWPLCTILNKISCFLVAFFYAASKSLYFEVLCFRNLRLLIIGGAAATAIILFCFYAAMRLAGSHPS